MKFLRWIKSYLSQTWGILKILSSKKKIIKAKAFFICAKEDHAISINNKSVSQILDPIRFQFEKEKITCASFFWHDMPNESQRYFYSSILPFLYFPFGLKVLMALFGKPKLIVAIGWNKRLLKFAKKLKILTVEPIHGFGLGKNDLVWGINQRNKGAPDLFLCFDNQTRNTLNKNKFKTYNVVRCRYHGLDRHICKKFQNKKFIAKVVKNYNKKIILFTLQHGYDGSRKFLNGIINNGLIHEEVLSAFQALGEYFIIIKAHPLQLRSPKWENMQKRLISGLRAYKFINCTDFHTIDIYSILVKTHIHVTMMSGTINEAALLGIPSIGLCPSLIKNGVASDSFQYAKDRKLLIHCPLEKNKIIKTILTFRRKSKVSSEEDKENTYPSSFSVLKKYCDD